MFPCDFVTRVTFVTKCKLTLFHGEKVTKSQKSQSHIVTNGDRERKGYEIKNGSLTGEMGGSRGIICFIES